jgi:glycine C-acetyltransferase
MAGQMTGQLLLDRLEKQYRRELASGAVKKLRPLLVDKNLRTNVAGLPALVMCSNDYQGLAANEEVVAAATTALRQFGVGTASARFVCGTTHAHALLEESLVRYLGVEAAITFSSAWAANVGLYSALTEPGDVIFSDRLNHASIIDGCRMTARGVVREVYPHKDLNRLRDLLHNHSSRSGKIIVTDGVFSMEGDLAPLQELVGLAREYDALLVVDDSHGLGVIGRTGRGTAEYFDALNEVGVYVGTLGKTLGGGAGGFVAGPRAVVGAVTKRARPYIFSNPIPPAVAAAASKALEIIDREPGRISELAAKTAAFRSALREAGLCASTDITPIVPLPVGDSSRAAQISAQLLSRGVFAVAFGFPIVPEGEARIRFQVSRAHSDTDLEQAAEVIVATFGEAGLQRRSPPS